MPVTLHQEPVQVTAETERNDQAIPRQKLCVAKNVLWDHLLYISACARPHWTLLQSDAQLAYKRIRLYTNMLTQCNAMQMSGCVSTKSGQRILA
jgi:hypothetical protein